MQAESAAVRAAPAWVRLSAPSALPRLLCLPYAGGRGDGYHRWASGLAGTLEVWAADLPGRHRRASEPADSDPDTVIAELTAAAAALADRPLAIFGHSLGALLGFEVAAALERRGTGVAALVVSGSAAPQVRAARQPITPVSDAELVARLLRWGGTPRELLADREFRDLVLPPLRADLTLCDRYRYRGTTLRAPITALAGADDETAPAAEVALWQHCTVAWRGLRVLPGGHFFIAGGLGTLLNIVAAAVATEA